jgi:hypothetical protein
MAIRANVSFSQKHGQPDFGSVGAGCSLEFELDTTLLEKDSTALREQFDLAYTTCRQAVQQQLTPFEQSERVLSHAAVQSKTNGKKRPSRPATQSQQRALWAICNNHGLNLEAACRDEFDVPAADCLSIAQASSLIDKLKNENSVSGGAR